MSERRGRGRAVLLAVVIPALITAAWMWASYTLDVRAHGVAGGATAARAGTLAVTGTRVDLAFALLLAGAFVFAAVLGLVAIAAKRFRFPAVLAGVAVAAALLTFMLSSLAFGMHFRGDRAPVLQAVATNAQPLVAALERYHADQGHYPDALADLLPAYLPALPATGAALAPEFSYSTRPGWSSDDTGCDCRFDLSVVFPGGLGDNEQWHYCPPADRTIIWHATAAQRIGDWVLMVE